MYAAIPQCVGQWEFAPGRAEHFFDEVPPGHRFRLYFNGWVTRKLADHRVNEAQAEVEHLRRDGKKVGQAKKRLDKRRAQFNNTRDFESCDSEEWKKRALESIATGSRADAFAAWAERLGERQGQLARQVDAFSWHGRLLSPLAIGTGVEHPLENGHLFFDPHGLPFIPGSSVKGVLRRAAEELALFEDGGSARCKWTIPLVWLLFGFDQNAAYLRRVQPNAEMSRPWREAFGRHVDTLGEAGLAPLARQDGVVRALRDHFGDDTRPPEALVRALLERLRRDQGGQENGRDLEVLRLRGALDCWDAFFVPPRMRVDIMNPHYGAYYQTEGWTPPHETSPPNPIYFLAVDAGVRARFHVQWRPPARTTLPDGVDWKDLVASAFEHAARNLGFGAKTSVGYGRFESTDARSGTAGSAGGGGAMPQGPQRGQPGGAGGPSGGQVAVEKEHRTSVSRSLGSGEITAQVPGGVARWRPSPQGGDLSSLMPDELAQRLTRQNELPNVIVRYREDGNQRTILAVRAPDPTPPATRGGQS